GEGVHRVGGNVDLMAELTDVRGEMTPDAGVVVDDEDTRHRIRSPARQVEREAAPATHFALEVHPAAVCLDDVADDGEAEPRGADRPRLALHEPLEDALALVRRDARAAVGDDDPYLAAVRGRLDGHPSAARRVAERVRHQVRERP